MLKKNFLGIRTKFAGRNYSSKTGRHHTPQKCPWIGLTRVFLKSSYRQNQSFHGPKIAWLEPIRFLLLGLHEGRNLENMFREHRWHKGEDSWILCINSWWYAERRHRKFQVSDQALYWPQWWAFRINDSCKQNLCSYPLKWDQNQLSSVDIKRVIGI